MTSRSSILALAACAALISSTGCEQRCELERAFDAAGFLDPFTGQCVFGPGGGGTCGDFGGAELEVPLPEMALCWSSCTGLAESECQATPGCRAGYVGDCLAGDDCDNTTYRFFECWQTPPSGPIQGDCAGLDAWECSLHDDCVALHFAADTCDGGGDCAPGFIDPSAIGVFEACAAEGDQAPGCYGDQDCAPGTRCNAAEVCLPPPGCGTPDGTGDPLPCDAVCYGYCVPDGSVAGNCSGDTLCDSLPPACPAGTTAGSDGVCWTGYCIPDAACANPGDPGACNDPAVCEIVPPACPENTVPGVADGCFTGYCIPLGACEAGGQCADIVAEAMCVAAAECVPVYAGQDCTCDPDGTCTCQSWIFDACADAP